MAISGLGREEDILVDEVVAQEAAAARAREESHALEEMLTVRHDPLAAQPATPCSRPEICTQLPDMCAQLPRVDGGAVSGRPIGSGCARRRRKRG